MPWWAAHLRAVPVRILPACMMFEMVHFLGQAPMQETRVRALATGSCPWVANAAWVSEGAAMAVLLLRDIAQPAVP